MSCESRAMSFELWLTGYDPWLISHYMHIQVGRCVPTRFPECD